MKTKKLPLGAVLENRDNPRIISDARFEKLIDNCLPSTRKRKRDDF